MIFKPFFVTHLFLNCIVLSENVLASGFSAECLRPLAPLSVCRRLAFPGDSDDNDEVLVQPRLSVNYYEEAPALLLLPLVLLVIVK